MAVQKALFAPARLGEIFFGLVMALLIALSLLLPISNWDVLPYTALVQGRGHDAAYATVRESVSAAKWAELTEESPYRRIQYSDPAAFEAQLGMYRIKPGYVAVARAFGAVLPPLTALHAVNALALLLIAAVSFLWMRRRAFSEAALLIVPAWMAMRLLELSLMVTPDLLCAATALAGVALLRFNRWVPAALAFALATAIRPDFITFPAAFLLVALLLRTDAKAAFVALLLSAIAYASISLSGSYPGWWAHFARTMFETELTAPPPFSLRLYLAGLLSGVTTMLTQAWPWITFICIILWARKSRLDSVFLALILSLAIRVLAFPLAEERLYLPTVMILVMLTAELLSGTHRLDHGEVEHERLGQRSG